MDLIWNKKMGVKRKTLKKLQAKVNVISNWLEDNGVKVDRSDIHQVLALSYRAFGREYKPKRRTVPGAHAHLSVVLGWIEAKAPVPPAADIKQKVAGDEKRKKFYRSYEWRKVRYDILKRDGGRCQLCGATAADGAVMNVDHIRPLKKYWALRLDPDNLQTLCGACNHGKGNRDETDWREPDVRTLMGERLH